MRKLWWLFIVLGVMVIAAPRVIEWYADREQGRLLQAAEHREVRLDPGLISSYEQLSGYLQEGSASEDDESTVSALSVPDEEGLLGIIEISSIDVKLPILEGATKENMRASAVHLSDTATLGSLGNAAIAAHRARTTGRLFNRLDEVQLGDKVIIHTGDKVYTYEVNNILVVEPTDVSVLSSDGKESLLTLITCTPLNVSTHRLIIQAKLMS
ncbi:class D sortase [Paenibacillus motobuensis]|uniref:class D sortase n=1 Tax=Paenibacillus TaxID=44249 RepID=UPI002040EEB5|nr:MULTISPECIES: class D sortase [Paenibacillus]MCM3038371.1 class D sortase [Paenibacillus lutimineralis]MCM3645475.1 class D sortase [Paenibacillus motobuensis]